MTRPENAKIVKNKVIARGRVIGYGRNEYGYLGLTLFIRGTGNVSRRNSAATSRRANTRNENDGTYVHFTYGKNATMPLDVTINSNVEILGHVEANIVKSDMWDKTSYIQYLVIDEIKKADTQLEEAFGDVCKGMGFAYPAPFISVALMGEILKITKSDPNAEDASDTSRVWTRLRMKVDSEDGTRPSIVEMQYSSNMRVSDVDCKVGDIVCVTAMMISRQKTTKGNTQPRNFENIIVNDMAIIESAHPEMEAEDIFDVLAESEVEKEVKPEHKATSFGGLSVNPKN